MTTDNELSSEQVTAKLAEMTAAYRAGRPQEMTSEQAGEQLAMMQKEHTLAQARGDTAQPTLEQFLNAHRAEVARRDDAALVDHLTEVGLSPATPVGAEVMEFVQGKRSITPELRAELDAKIDSWGRDAEFMKKLLSGDPQATKLFQTAVGMKRAPVEAA